MTENPPTLVIDFDGVLNDWAAPSAEYLDAWNNHRRDEPWRLLLPRLVAKVEYLATVTEAVVVVSSTWRRLYRWVEVVDFLRRQGLSVPLAGTTPEIGSRGADITEYLRQHPDVTNYVVLDDDKAAARIPDPTRFVCIDPAVGITDADVERAIEILRRGI